MDHFAHFWIMFHLHISCTIILTLRVSGSADIGEIDVAYSLLPYSFQLNGCGI